jgi:hypothetical protein
MIIAEIAQHRIHDHIPNYTALIHEIKFQIFNSAESD